jgi:hypothetical protein
MKFCETYENLCRKKDPQLPAEWELYLFQILPETAGYSDYTHIELRGAIPRVLSKGPNKGAKRWGKKVSQKTFILSRAEVEKFQKGVDSPAAADVEQGELAL